MAVTDPTLETPPAPSAEPAPWHLRGNYAPVPDEIEAFDLPVRGTIPGALEGRYLRNGANPESGWSAHWFAGDGMIHGLRLRDGRAEWYRNRWVRTKALAGVDRMDMSSGTMDLTVGLANTHVIGYAGRILALEEGSYPNELSPELETLGPRDFDGRLTTSMTAHPHVCAETGEMHFFGYGFLPPYLTYHLADPDGRLVMSEVIDVPGATMMHDFALSRNHAVFMDLPMVFDLDEAIRGGMPIKWSDDYGARIGLLRRGRPGSETRWFDIDPCYVFHIMNAWDDGESTVWLDAGRHASMWRDGSDDFEPSYLWRWRFDLESGTVHEEQLDDRSHGFPRIDDRRTGLVNRYGWASTGRPGEPESMDSATVVVKYDLQEGTSSLHDFGPGRACGEPVFVPSGPGEDEGWLMTFVYDASRDSSDWVLLDAADMDAEPLAVVPLPRRVPHGFHGSWIPD